MAGSAKPCVHFINRFFYPDHSATSQILQGIAFGLAARGHEVHVTTSRQLYERSAVLPRREIVRGVTIHRVTTTRFGRDRIFGRTIDYATFHAAAGRHLLRIVKQDDVLVAKTDPPLISVIAALVARRRDAILVNWLQDIFPEIATAVNFGGRWARLPLRAIRPVRDWSLTTARRNVVIGECMADYLDHIGVPRDCISQISNWADPDVVHPIEESCLLDAWGLRGKLVIGYSGNLGRAHDVETLVEAADAISRRADDPVAASIEFVFIGGGAGRALLEREVAARSLRNVRFFPYQPTGRLAATLALPDIHLVSLRPGLEGFVVPSKVYGVMAAARPTVFIGAADGEVARLVRRHGVGEIVAAGDWRGLVEILLGLARDAPRRKRMGAAARRAFEATYTKCRSAHLWEQLLAEVSASTPARQPFVHSTGKQP